MLVVQDAIHDVLSILVAWAVDQWLTRSVRWPLLVVKLYNKWFAQLLFVDCFQAGGSIAWYAEQVDLRPTADAIRVLETVVSILVWFAEFQMRSVLVPGEWYTRGWGRNIGGSNQTQQRLN